MKKTLLILAAGIGSRFNGNKQTFPIGPNNEFLLHYSIYDAIKVGFNKIVFVIKKEDLQNFKNHIGKLIENKVETHYVFQNIPIKNRTKPLGTAHAVFVARHIIKENFAIINADDFYGRNAFQKIYNSLNQNNFSIINYKLEKTLSKHGSVKRGICISKNNQLQKIIECKIIKKNNKIFAEQLENNRQIKLKQNTLVSMGMFSLTPKIFEFIKKDIETFFKINYNKISDVEYYLPDVLTKMIQENEIKIKTINTESNWFGITYKEDLTEVKENIEKLIENKEYPRRLF